MVNGLTVTNRYDELLRRTNAQFQVFGAGQFDQGYGYDDASWLGSVTLGGNSVLYDYLANSALIDTQTFKRDDTTRMTTTRDYDALNRLTGYTATPYGRRMSKVVAHWVGGGWSNAVERTFAYDGWNLVAEVDAVNQVVRPYLWGSDLSGTMQGAGGVGGLVVVNDADYEAHFVAYDGNGNVVALAQATNGAVSATYEYDPFGRTIRISGAMGVMNPIRFSSK